MVSQEIRQKLLGVSYTDDEIDSIEEFKDLSEEQLDEIDAMFMEYCKNNSCGYYGNKFDPMGYREFDDFIQKVVAKGGIKGISNTKMVKAAAALYTPCIDVGNHMDQCNEIADYAKDYKDPGKGKHNEPKNDTAKDDAAKGPSMSMQNGKGMTEAERNAKAEAAEAAAAYNNIMTKGSSMSELEWYESLNKVLGNIYKNDLKTRDTCNLARYLSMSQRSTYRGKKLAKEFNKLVEYDAKLTVKLEKLRLDAKRAAVEKLEDEQDKNLNVSSTSSKPADKKSFIAFAPIFTALGHGIGAIGAKLKAAISRNKDTNEVPDKEKLDNQFGQSADDTDRRSEVLERTCAQMIVAMERMVKCVQDAVQAQMSGKTIEADKSDDAEQVNNDEPSASNDESSASNDEPSVSNDEPSASNDEPSASNDEPSASNDEPSASNDEPSASNDGERQVNIDELFANAGKNAGTVDDDVSDTGWDEYYDINFDEAPVDNEGEETSVDNEGEETSVDNEGEETSVNNEGEEISVDNDGEEISVDNEDGTPVNIDDLLANAKKGRSDIDEAVLEFDDMPLDDDLYAPNDEIISDESVDEETTPDETESKPESTNFDGNADIDGASNASNDEDVAMNDNLYEQIEDMADTGDEAITDWNAVMAEAGDDDDDDDENKDDEYEP